MNIKMYQVDAFTDSVFKGNPAAVCVLDKFLSDDIMQNIAAENNLAETAFIVPDKDEYQIRWFTPIAEIDLCGHATLASAFVVFNYVNPEKKTVKFSSKLAGELIVTKNDDILSMDFPSRPPKHISAPEGLEKALGAKYKIVLASRDLLIIFDKEEDVLNLKPKLKDFDIKDCMGVIITAPASEKRKSTDFVSRFFAPKMGIAEDPVTGSSHCTLIPYWAERLGKNNLIAEQLSKRTGKLFCENKGDRVIISGNAVCYLNGEIEIKNVDWGFHPNNN